MLLSHRLNALAIIILMSFFLFLYNNKERMILGYSRDRLQYLSECGCYRGLSQDILEDSANISLRNTTCSESAYYKGSHQKVISFTFFEPSESDPVPNNKSAREYFRGIEENLSLVKKFYPGYNMRIYYQVFNDVTQSRLCNLGESLLNYDCGCCFMDPKYIK